MKTKRDTYQSLNTDNSHPKLNTLFSNRFNFLGRKLCVQTIINTISVGDCLKHFSDTKMLFSMSFHLVQLSSLFSLLPLEETIPYNARNVGFSPRLYTALHIETQPWSADKLTVKPHTYRYHKSKLQSHCKCFSNTQILMIYMKC